MVNAIVGFLEGVDAFQLRGWAYDPLNPSSTLTVEVVIGEQPVAQVKADLYRSDLEKNSIGAGNHAFIFNFEGRLADDERSQVGARVVRSDGTFEILERYVSGISASAAPKAPQLTFRGIISDTEANPVFVLGAARSGTSAIAQGLLKLERYNGHQEGHLLDLLAHLTVSLKRFYDEKGDDTAGDRDTSLSMVPRAYFERHLNEIFLRTMKSLFPDGAWIDKTPNSNMIHLAPRFYQMWPNARFIFMKRRFLENAISRSRKFPQYDFARNCQEWSDAMEAWLSNRSRLTGVAIEIDQDFLNRNPSSTAQTLKEFLKLSNMDAQILEQAFQYDRPERTSATTTARLDISQIGWRKEEQDLFERYCATLMRDYGYSFDSAYFLNGCDSGGLVLV